METLKGDDNQFHNRRVDIFEAPSGSINSKIKSTINHLPKTIPLSWKFASWNLQRKITSWTNTIWILYLLVRAYFIINYILEKLKNDFHASWPCCDPLNLIRNKSSYVDKVLKAFISLRSLIIYNHNKGLFPLGHYEHNTLWKVTNTWPCFLLHGQVLSIKELQLCWKYVLNLC